MALGALLVSVAGCADLFGPGRSAEYVLESIDGNSIPYERPGNPITTYLGDTIRVDPSGQGVWVSRWEPQIDAPQGTLTAANRVRLFRASDGQRFALVRPCLQLSEHDVACSDETRTYSVTTLADGIEIDDFRGRLRFRRIEPSK